MSSFSTTKTYNLKYIPIFTADADTDINTWSNANNSGPAVLLKKQWGKYAVNRVKGTVLSTDDSLRDSIDSTAVLDASVVGGQFQIKSVVIKLNETLANHLNLVKFGVNPNRGTLDDDSADNTILFQDYQTFLTNKINNYTYQVLINDDIEALVDTDIEKGKLFNFYIDSVPKYKVENGILVPEDFTEDEVSLNLEEIVLFDVQITGEYLDIRKTGVNRNTLTGDFQITVSEYLRKVSIFEDNQTEILPIQLSEVSIIRKNKYFIPKNSGYSRSVKYTLGKGVLRNADISTGDKNNAVNVPLIRVKEGVLIVQNANGQDIDFNLAGSNYWVSSFYFIAEDASVLPNPYDDKVYVFNTFTPNDAITNANIIFS